MTRPEPSPSPGAMTAQTSAIATALFCWLTFTALIWPIGRMWQMPVRDWQMLAPALALETFMAGLAFTALVRVLILSRRQAQRPTLPKQQRRTAANHPPAAPPARAAWPAFEFSQPYPEPAADLGEPFAAMMRTVASLPFRDGMLRRLMVEYGRRASTPGFGQAEAFIVRKVQDRPDYDPGAVAAGRLDPGNVAVQMARAEEVLTYAAVVAGMVLIADELPEQVWDLLAAPWEAADLPFPQVVLAG